MRFLGFIFISLLISTTVVIGDFYWGGDFLDGFLKDGLVETFGILVGFNMAGLIFLLGQISELQIKYKIDFQDTKKELKHNLLVLLSTFLLTILFLVFLPSLNFDEIIQFNIIKILIVSTFVLGILAVFEIANSIFLLVDNANSKEEK